MRKIVLLFVVLLSSVAFCQGKDVPCMFSGNSYWMYRNSEIQYDKEYENTYGGSAVCMYDDCRIPKEMVDGREYSVLRRITATAGICSRDNDLQLHVREDGGKVYGLKDEYVQMMSILFGMAEDSLFIEDCGNGEVLLYDFTMEVGDEVVLEEGVMGYVVTDVSYIDFQGRELKKLTFSPWSYVEDGSKYVDYDIQDIWVEGMGSNGGLLTPFPSSLTDNWSHLDYISLPDGSKFSFSEITNVKQFVEKKGKEGVVYDLSGRRVANSSEFQGSNLNISR